MKTILIIPLLLLSACASHQPPKLAVLTAEPGQPVNSLDDLRSQEQVKAYRFGRYADPGDRTVMHEAHPVYRVEKSASWNLRPDGFRSAEISKAAIATERDALVAELNRQKAATKTLTDQAVSLSQQWASGPEFLMALAIRGEDPMQLVDDFCSEIVATLRAEKH